MEFFTLVVAILLGLIAYLYLKEQPRARSRVIRKGRILGKNLHKRPANAFWSGKAWLQEQRAGHDRRSIHDRRRSIRLEDDRRIGHDRRSDISAWETAH